MSASIADALMAIADSIRDGLHEIAETIECYCPPDYSGELTDIVVSIENLVDKIKDKDLS